MARARDMLMDYPRHLELEPSLLGACIEACFVYAQVCIACADACLGEDDPQPLRRCIRFDLDRGDVCGMTNRLLSRQTEPNWTAQHAHTEACVVAFRACAAECERHTERHEYCQTCAAACRPCEEAYTPLTHRRACVVRGHLLPLWFGVTSAGADPAVPGTGFEGGRGSDGCDRWRDEVELYALGALGQDEVARIERHAAVCGACSAELRAAGETAVCLALAVPLVRAPAAMRDAVLRRAHSAHGGNACSPPSDRPAGPSR